MPNFGRIEMPAGWTSMTGWNEFINWNQRERRYYVLIEDTIYTASRAVMEEAFRAAPQDLPPRSSEFRRAIRNQLASLTLGRPVSHAYNLDEWFDFLSRLPRPISMRRDIPNPRWTPSPVVPLVDIPIQDRTPPGQGSCVDRQESFDCPPDCPCRETDPIYTNTPEPEGPFWASAVTAEHREDY